MKKYLNFDGMSWPNPMSSDLEEIGWRLLYGTPSKTDLTFAVSVMHAYSWLILQETQRSRNSKVSKIRAIVKHLYEQEKEKQ